MGFDELVVRNNKGGFTGFFVEETSHIVNVLSRTEEQLYSSAKKATKVLNQYGIIGVKDSFVRDPEYQTWKALHDNGELTANVGFPWLWTGDDTSITFEQQQEAMVEPSSRHILF